jgi:Fe-S oxidoreductase
MRVFDSPRKVLLSIPGIQLVEMGRSRAEAMCCGVDAWMCNSNSKQMQVERLQEAKMSGADMLVTTCPKCQIHFRCVMSEKLPKAIFPVPDEAKIEVADLSELVARALGS